MRVACYLLAALTLLPYILLATGFTLLGYAISGGTLLALLDALLTAALWLIPWGLLAFAVAFVGLLMLGMSDRWRWLGGLCLCLVAFASLVVIIGRATPDFDLPHLLFLLPCAAILAFGGWLAAFELRHRQGGTSRPPGRELRAPLRGREP